MKKEIDFDLTGLTKTIEALDKMGVKINQAVDKAARAGLKPVKHAIKAEAPVGKNGGGTLKKSIERKREKTKFSGKRVYEVRISPKLKNKEIKRPGIYGGKSTTGYYPASQEYGFLTARKNGGKTQYRYNRMFANLPDYKQLDEYSKKHDGDDTRTLRLTRYSKNGKRIYGVESVEGKESRSVEGKHYMKRGAEQAEGQSKQIMIQTLEKELDELWKEMKHE